MNYRNFSKFYVIISVIVIIIICSYLIITQTDDYCTIEQDISIYDYNNNTYKVTTYIKIYNFIGTTLDYKNFNYIYDVKGSEIDSIKKVEYDKIYPSYIMVKEFLKGEIIK